MVTLTMNGPGKNALGTDMLRFVLEGLERAAGAPVLLTGAGDAFSAGLDLREVASLDATGMRTFLDLLEACVVGLYTYPGPTVALVNGHAIAGGCVLTLACDHRVAQASPKLKIGLNETALGVRFPPRTLEVVRRRVPSHQAERVLLGAGLFDVGTACALGLVDEVAEDAAAVAAQRLAALSSHPAEAYAATKADLRGRTAQDVVPDAEAERRIAEALPSWVSPAVKAKLARVLAK